MLVVPALPRGAAVELHVTAVQDDPAGRTSCHVTSKSACGSIECHGITSSDLRSASLSLTLTSPKDQPEVGGTQAASEAVAAIFKEAVEKMEAGLVPLCARVFYSCTHVWSQELAGGMSADTYHTGRQPT